MSRRCYFIATSWQNQAVPNQFKALAQTLAARGSQVVLLVDGRRTDAENHDGNPAIYTWPSKRPVHLRDALFLGRLIRKYRPDTLIANFGAVNVMLIGGWLARVPTRIAWYHTILGASIIDHEAAGWQQQLQIGRKRLIYHAATSIVACSQAAADDVQQVYAIPLEKLSVWHNVLADPLAQAQIVEATRQRAANNIVCVGHLYANKGQDVLLRAFARLIPTMPDASLTLVGDGPRRQANEHLAQELGIAGQCRFLGARPHEDALAHMASAAVVVVPSREEAFGLVNVEALAVGTPVVASRVGGIPEVVRDGVDGLLVPAGDPNALADALEILLTNPALREAMGHNGRQRFLSHFELQNNVPRLAQWIEQPGPTQDVDARKMTIDEAEAVQRGNKR